MELTQVLERLKFTIDKAKTLKAESFNYGYTVKVFDDKKHCGTVCCIVGHYPNWKVEGFSYYGYDSKVRIGYLDGSEHFIDYDLTDYHGLSIDLIRFLFFGQIMYNPLFENVPYSDDLEDYSLEEVIERFELVYNLLEQGKISPDLECEYPE